MSADSEAYALSLRVSPELTDAEREYALIVARHESFYGRATKPAAWVGTHNWGAVQGQGPAGSFVATDTHADGSAYQGKFKRYNSDDEGWLDLVRILLKPNVRAALAKGDAAAACTAQRANRYFEAPLAKYQAALERNYAFWKTATGRAGALSFPLASNGLSESSGSPSSLGPPFVIRRNASLPVLSDGSYGDAVRMLCLLLGHTDITPRYDVNMRAQVAAWQEAHGLVADGVCGPNTWNALLQKERSMRSQLWGQE